MTVRKAVYIAGAERVVIAPMSQRLCAIDMEECYCEQSAAQMEAHVRLEVTADDSHYGGIVSSIRRIAHAGRIVLASRHDMLQKHAA